MKLSYNIPVEILCKQNVLVPTSLFISQSELNIMNYFPYHHPDEHYILHHLSLIHICCIDLHQGQLSAMLAVSNFVMPTYICYSCTSYDCIRNTNVHNYLLDSDWMCAQTVSYLKFMYADVINHTQWRSILLQFSLDYDYSWSFEPLIRR